MRWIDIHTQGASNSYNIKGPLILDDGNLAVMVTRNATPSLLITMQNHDGVDQSYFTSSLT